MRKILDIPYDSIVPDRGEALSLQGIPQDSILPPKILDMYDKAFGVFQKSVKPAGIITYISAVDLENILTIAGGNIINSVLSSIFRKSQSLALYAFTLGELISDTISDLFDRNDIALGSMLDSIASAAADRGGSFGENYFLEHLREIGAAAPETKVLMYSPGYCGWNISGQKKLFRYLKPGDIGISLNESLMMIPLKSVSGVLVSGKKEIHYIKEDFDFCRECTGKHCRDRISNLKKGK